jgi:hypothetical protein
MADRPHQQSKKSVDPAEMAVLASAAGGLKDKARAATPPHKGGSEILTAVVTVAIVVITLAIMIYTNKPVTG